MPSNNSPPEDPAVPQTDLARRQLFSGPPASLPPTVAAPGPTAKLPSPKTPSDTELELRELRSSQSELRDLVLTLATSISDQREQMDHLINTMSAAGAPDAAKDPTAAGAIAQDPTAAGAPALDPTAAGVAALDPTAAGVTSSLSNEAAATYWTILPTHNHPSTMHKLGSKPSAALLALHRFSSSDTQVYEFDTKNKCPMPADAYAKLLKTKEQACLDLESIVEPGPQAELAIQAFTGEVLAAINQPQRKSVAALLIEGLTRGPAGPRSKLTQDLLRVAVTCGTVAAIHEQVQRVQSSGSYDRRLAKAGDVAEMENFVRFDPTTTEGSALWDATGRLVMAFFSLSECAQADRNSAENAYRRLRCSSSESAKVFLAVESDAYDEFVRAGGLYSEQQRIKFVLEMCSVELQQAYYDFRKRKVEDKLWSTAHETEFAVFADDFEGVAAAIRSTGRAEQTESAERIQPNEKNTATCHNVCWQWSRLGQCEYGDKCKWPHTGKPGALKAEVADANGYCLQEKYQGKCSRKICTLRHQADKGHKQDSERCLTTDQANAIAAYAKHRRKKAADVTLEEIGQDGGITKWANKHSEEPLIFCLMADEEISY